ncbi:unnamed protein product, partial [marine sediment metagenome]
MHITGITKCRKMEKAILLGHGSGGKLSHDLIRDVFV